MLEQLLTYLHNWFRVRDSVDGKHPGTYAVEDGEIALPFLQNGQYFRIIGSVFNDGLHRYGPEMEALQDETFTGTVWALAVPKAVIELADEIEAWQKKYGATVASPFTSESFGGYSYSKAATADTSIVGWESVFKPRLNQWRKVSEI